MDDIVYRQMDADAREERNTQRLTTGLSVCQALAGCGTFIVLAGILVVMGKFYGGMSELVDAAKGMDSSMGNITAVIDYLLDCAEHTGICHSPLDG